jgi:hypothetical protein
MGHGRFGRVLVCIAAAAFLGRAVYVTTVTRDQTRTYDELFYESEASSFANGDGFEPSAFGVNFLGSGEHPPLTAVVLSPVGLVTDDNETAMLMTMALAGASSGFSGVTSQVLEPASSQPGSPPSIRTCG